MPSLLDGIPEGANTVPPGVRYFNVKPGWDGITDNFRPRHGSRETVSIRGMHLPRFFTMYVRFVAGTSLVTYWELDADEVPIASAALSEGDLDVVQALTELTSERPLTWWATKCLISLAFHAYELDGDGMPVDWREQTADRLHGRAVSASRLPTTRRNNRITDTLLREVAEVYRANMSTGRPTVAVQKHFHVERAQAARYVRKARDAGFLGDALGPKPGETESS